MLSLRSITPLQCISYIVFRMYLKRIFILIDDGIYFFLEFLGGFIAAGLVYGTYYDAINRFDNGTRQVKKHLFI